MQIIMRALRCNNYVYVALFWLLTALLRYIAPSTPPPDSPSHARALPVVPVVPGVPGVHGQSHRRW